MITGFEPNVLRNAFEFSRALRRKDFICVAELSERDVCACGFVEEFARMCRDVSPLVRFLCGALDAPL